MAEEWMIGQFSLDCCETRDGRPLKVLVIGQHLDAHDVGESLMAYKLVNELCRLADITVLALECFKGPALAEQLPEAEVVTWREPRWLRRHERLNAMMKLNTLFLASKVEQWLRAARSSGRSWDVAHQLMPAAPRYASVLRKFDTPYVIGPIGGALPTPKAFRHETASAAWFTRLRRLDELRFKFDPWLRASYAGAEIVLGVAPYVEEVIRPVPVRKFRSFLGIGVDGVVEQERARRTSGALRLLHVGRAVRTKGLRDVVRAMAHLRDRDVTLTSIGEGEEIPICKQLALDLGVADKIEFLGKLPRAEIDHHFASSDVFVFPSFRESMGIVLFEAMSWGLPTVTVRTGGPDWIVSDDCGLKVEVTDPVTMPRDLASAIGRLADAPDLRTAMGRAARAKLLAEQVWPRKASKMLEYYCEARSTASDLANVCHGNRAVDS